MARCNYLLVGLPNARDGEWGARYYEQQLLYYIERVGA